jgi:hypothetical protein
VENAHKLIPGSVATRAPTVGPNLSAMVSALCFERLNAEYLGVYIVVEGEPSAEQKTFGSNARYFMKAALPLSGEPVVFRYRRHRCRADRSANRLPSCWFGRLSSRLLPKIDHHV